MPGRTVAFALYALGKTQKSQNEKLKLIKTPKTAEMFAFLKAMLIR